MTDPKQTDAIEQLIGRFRTRSDNAYIEYIGACRQDACLGWEAKTASGKFGEAELKAHTKAAQFLGRHYAFAEAANLLYEMSRQPLPEPPKEEK